MAGARRIRAARSRRSRLVSGIAGGVALAVIATIAVVAAGYDARETPREEPSVWAMRSSGQYARVNTITAEIDTVRSVEDPTGVVQSGAQGIVLSHGNGRAWPIDPAVPENLIEEGEEGEEGEGNEETGATEETAVPAGGTGNGDTEGPTAVRTPSGTRDAISAGDSVLFRTEDGQAFLSTVKDPDVDAAALSQPRLLDPLAEEQRDGEAGDPESRGEEDGEAERFRADAAAIDAEGTVALFSAAEHTIHWYDAGSEEFRGSAQVPDGVPESGVQLAVVGGSWVLFEASSGRLWLEGAEEPVSLDTGEEARLQASSARDAGNEVLIADGSGLWRVAGGEAERVAEADGVPAQPVSVGAERYAAWIGPSEAAMWSSADDRTQLELDESVTMPGDPEPVIRTNGSRALLSEVQTGMLWTVPDGRLIPVEQWSLVDPPKREEGTVVVREATEQQPPVAVDDAFGVRANEPAPLPVLLNDFDPNRRDVLTVVPEGLGEGLPPDFGAVEMLGDGQSLVFRPGEGAQGSASFTYRITDGVAVSEPATVVLAVAPPETHSAPQWCPVEGCQREWPAPELAPGGTLVLPILEGWVDPEGDPMMLADASPVNADDPARALVTADGRLALRHTDPNAGESDIAVRIRVEDGFGESTERELRVAVRSGASAELRPIASTVRVNEPATLRPLTRVTGGSGSYALVDAVAQSGAATVAVNTGAGTIDVSAPEAGSSIVALTIRDTVTEAEISGVMRVTAVDAGARLALPPLRAFVRPLADTTVEVFDAIPGADSRALVVSSASVIDGQLRADVIEHARVRVSGSTADGAPGRIGSIDVAVADGAETAVGRLTVFQVPDSGSEGAIAVSDTATVRAGSVIDIPVLENDVAPPGQRLVLHPEIAGSEAEGELAFASGNTLRYLAPREPGTYTLSYTAYGASSPEASDVGRVQVTVVPRDGNRDPQPRTVTVRLAPGERTAAQVPLSGVDPDGDRVRLVGVNAFEDPQLTATLAPRSSAIQVGVSERAEPGVRTVEYAVRDEFGGDASGRLRVVVTDPATRANAPVTYSDYVRLTTGSREPAAVRPLDNDIDPAAGSLELVEVVPNVPGGEDSAEYRALAERLDLSAMDQGRVAVRGGEEPGTVSYRYTARSSASSSTADGLIVVQVSARVGQQAPIVRDTVLSAADRVELERGGIDVVTDRVRWASGDVSALKLSVWGAAAERFGVRGSNIVGEYRAEGDLVPFRLAGEDATGAAVESFGFLVIPPLDELRLTLKPGLDPISVDENRSVDVNVNDVVDLAPGDRAELRQGAFPVQREQASCESAGSGSLRYHSGSRAPWTDSCVISVKLAEQRVWTQLALPVQIVPTEPAAELRALTRTVAAGASETVDLADMVSWQGGREGRVGALRFEVSGGGQNFQLSSEGSRLTVQSRADAVPGAQDAVTVRVSGAGESQAPLTLRVGEAAKDAPRGATVALNCTVGSSCQAQVIGAPGEYDPFAGKAGGGLTLEAVDGSSCTSRTFRVSGGAVSVGWPDPRGPGGSCTASYTVRDAQGRAGTGTVELDAQGIPRPPAAISAVEYGPSSVTLEVQTSAQGSYPAVTGVTIEQDGGAVNASCSAAGGSYRCTVGGLVVGERHTFTARAVNEVGSSDRTASSVVAWAYATPAPPEVSTAQVSAESSTSGTVRFGFRGASGTSGYVLSVGGQTLSIDGRNASANVSGLGLGPQSYTVVPLSSYEPPPGHAREGAGTTGATVAVGGLPTVSISGWTTEPGSREVTVTLVVNSNGGSRLEYGVGVGESCSANKRTDDDGTRVETVRAQRYSTITIKACAKNRWGWAQSVTSEPIVVGGRLPPPGGDLTYTVDKTNVLPSATSTRYDLVPLGGPAPSSDVLGARFEYRLGGGAPTSSFVVPTAVGQTAEVRQCVDAEGGANCSDWVTVAPTRAPIAFDVALTGACYDGGNPPADPKSLISFTPDVSSYATATVGTPSASSIPITVTWSTPFVLDSVTYSACYKPPPPAP